MVGGSTGNQGFGFKVASNSYIGGLKHWNWVVLLLMIQMLHYLKSRTLNCGNYGIFLLMGNAGFIPPAVDILTFGPVQEHNTPKTQTQHKCK